MCDLFESLSPTLQAFLRTLSARHDGRRDLRQYGIAVDAQTHYPCHEHPVVVRHPETGRELLFVNGSFTERVVTLTASESDALLSFLCAKIAASTEFQCRVKWAQGTLVIWDNRMTQHKAVWDYYPEQRYGERVSIVNPMRPGE